MAVALRSLFIKSIGLAESSTDPPLLVPVP
jgi:hypothetical protein